MSMLVETVNYQDHSIYVYVDDVPETPNDWDDDVVLLYNHPQFQITHNDWNIDDIVDAFSHGEGDFRIVQNKKGKSFYAYPVFAYIHSGVMLSLTNQTYPFTDPFDTSLAGFIAVEQSNPNPKNLASSKIVEWNCILMGEVYFIEVYDSNEEFVDSIGGLIGQDNLENTYQDIVESNVV